MQVTERYARLINVDPSINYYEICEFRVSTFRLLNELLRSGDFLQNDESIKNINSTHFNKNYFLASAFCHLKTKKLDDRTIFKTIQKMLAAGVTAHSYYFDKDKRCALNPLKLWSVLSLVMEPNLAGKKPCFALINMLIVHGGFLCEQRLVICNFMIDAMSLDNPAALKNVQQALEGLFNRIKPLLIGITDKHSLVHMLSRDLFACFLKKQLWIEAHTYRTNEFLSKR